MGDRGTYNDHTPTIVQAHDLIGAEEDSMAHKLPDNLKEVLKRHVETHPQYFGVDEQTLARLLRKDEYTPTATDHRIRMNFWFEYDRACGMTRQMATPGIYHGACSREYLMGQYIKHAHKVAWMVCPPASYSVKVSEALEFGIEQLRDLLALPHMSNQGKLDVRLGELKVKIVAMLDMRVKGAVVQKSLNVNVSAADRKAIDTLAQESTMESLEKQLKELDRLERRAKNLPIPKEDIEVEHARIESEPEGTSS